MRRGNTATVITWRKITYIAYICRIYSLREIYNIASVYCTTRESRKCVNRPDLFSRESDTVVIVNHHARFPGLIAWLKREHQFTLILKFING